MQNALEACGRMKSANRYVSISSRQRQQALIAEGVQNGDDAAAIQSAGTKATHISFDMRVETMADGKRRE